MKRTLIIIILAVFFVGALIFVLKRDALRTSTLSVQQKPLTVTIGWIGPLTGPVSVLGVDNLKAVQLAVNEYNASRSGNKPLIKLLFEDDGYISDKSVEIYEKMVEEHKANVIILSTYNAMFAVASRVSADNVIVINPVDNDDYLAGLNQNMFMIAKSTKDMARVIVDDLTKTGKNTLYTLYYESDNFMPILADNIRAQFVRQQNRRVISEGYDRTKTDFTSALQKGLLGNADAYVFLGYAELGTAMKQAQKLGITAPFYAVNTSMEETAKGILEGARVAQFTEADGNAEQAKKFVNAYTSAYGKAPDALWVAMQAYDAANIAIRAISKAATEEGALTDRIRTNIQAFNDYRSFSSGVSGDIRILPDRTSRGITWSMYTFKNGTIVK